MVPHIDCGNLAYVHFLCEILIGMHACDCDLSICADLSPATIFVNMATARTRKKINICFVKLLKKHFVRHEHWHFSFVWSTTQHEYRYNAANPECAWECMCGWDRNLVIAHIDSAHAHMYVCMFALICIFLCVTLLCSVRAARCS